MYSHTKKFIFVHIPKVAGTSISGSTIVKTKLSEHAEPLPAKNYSINNLPYQPEDTNKFNPPGPHLRAIDYLNYNYVTEAQFDEYFKFTFVRNPWDRIVSEYKYRGHFNRFSFKEFLFYNMPRPSWSDTYCHVIPQYDFLYDSSGKLLVDFVGRFENLQADYDIICQNLDIPQHKILHENKSLGLHRDSNWTKVIIKYLNSLRGSLNGKKKANSFSHYTEYYDAESRDFVAALYRKDIEAFGYEFGK